MGSSRRGRRVAGYGSLRALGSFVDRARRRDPPRRALPGSLVVSAGQKTVTAPLQSSTTTVSRTAWLVVGLLMPVGLLNYLDRQLLASMQSSVMDSIPSLGQAENREELWGYMLGQFKWVYAVCS